MSLHWLHDGYIILVMYRQRGNELWLYNRDEKEKHQQRTLWLQNQIYLVLQLWAAKLRFPFWQIWKSSIGFQLPRAHSLKLIIYVRKVNFFLPGALIRNPIRSKSRKFFAEVIDLFSWHATNKAHRWSIKTALFIVSASLRYKKQLIAIIIGNECKINKKLNASVERAQVAVNFVFM